MQIPNNEETSTPGSELKFVGLLSGPALATVLSAILFALEGVPKNFGSLLAPSNSRQDLSTVVELLAYLFIASTVALVIALRSEGRKAFIAAAILHLQLVTVPCIFAFILNSLHQEIARAEIICVWGFFTVGILWSLTIYRALWKKA